MRLRPAKRWQLGFGSFSAHGRELAINRRQQQIAFDGEQIQSLKARSTVLAAEFDTLESRREPAGVALQAIRAFGPDHLTDGVIRQLRHNLPSDAKTGLKKLAHHAPQWMASAIDAVTA